MTGRDPMTGLDLMTGQGPMPAHDPVAAPGRATASRDAAAAVRPGAWVVAWRRTVDAGARVPLLLSGLFGVLALGLPYGSWNLPGYVVPGWYIPDSCVWIGPIGDQTLDCTPGYYSPGFIQPDMGGLQSGGETSWRVVLVVVLALTLLVLRTGSRPLARVTLAVGTLGLVAGGIAALPGVCCAVAAIVLLAIAFRRLDLIGARRRV